MSPKFKYHLYAFFIADQIKTQHGAGANRKIKSHSRQPLSPIFSALIQHSSTYFKPGDTECILSAVARMFSSPAISCAGRHSRQQTASCDLNHKDGASDSRRCNLHPHLSNENTKLCLLWPALHYSVYMWLYFVCAFLPLGGVCSHNVCNTQVSCIADDVTAAELVMGAP